MRSSEENKKTGKKKDMKAREEENKEINEK
jgi:hypothetical protein